MNSLREAILKEFTTAEVKDVVSNTPGMFNVSINGVLVFSRQEKKSYPSHEEILKILREL